MWCAVGWGGGGGGEGCSQETHLLLQNREIRHALDRKSRECEELRQELAKVRAMRATRIPVPLHTHSEPSWSVSEGSVSADPKAVVQSRGETVHVCEREGLGGWGRISGV